MSSRWSSWQTLVGTRIVVLLAATIPVGLLIGGAEIAFGSSLYQFLVEFGLVDAAETASSHFFGDVANPTALVISLGFITLMLRFLSQLLPSVLFETFNTRVRRAISEQSLGSVRETSTLTVNEVSHILSNLSPKSAAFIYASAQVVAAAFLFIAILGGLTILSRGLTVVAFGAAMILGIPILFLRRYQKYSAAVYQYMTVFTRRIVRDLRNIYYLKVSGENQHEKEALVGVTTTILKNHNRYAVLLAANATLPAFLSVLVAIAIVWSNAKFHFVPLADLVPFVYLLARVAAAVSQVTTATAQIQYNLPFFREMATYRHQLFEERPEPQTEGTLASPVKPTEISVEGLIVGRAEPLISGISFAAGAGETVVISGKSGKGKTTLLMTIIGIVQKLGGSIRWNGVAIEQIDPSVLREAVGYAGADPFLLDGSVDDNLLFGNSRKKYSDEEIEAALQCACADFVAMLPGGRKHLLREGGEGISAGQKQRLAIARSLLRRPSVLLLDEATANIDEDTERTIMERIRTRLPDALIIAISHRASMRQFATTHLDL